MPLHTSMRGLRCFCVAAECLSFKETAKKLYLTPSAVSHQIKQLEGSLNQALFIRQTRAVILTEVGIRFYQEVEPIMQQLVNTVSEFSQSERMLEVSISMPEFFASELFMPKLIGWSSKYPNINLKLETIKSRIDTIKHTDVSIMLSGKQQPSADVYDLFPITYIPACNASVHAELSLQGFKALTQVPLILHKARPHAWHQWAESVGFDGFQPKQIIQLDSMFSVARAAEQGLGVALIPLPISQAWFDNNTLQSLFPHPLYSHDRYYLTRHTNEQQRPEVQLLIDWILKSFHDESH
ncbi:LysR family transcriptional regulator [Shewanella polaris]|uniref:LysR family transcriptional regulator n=1 Tax=Shewanella polaris TaxID=2588449 RepID=A0A4Y5YKM2_9GAMM|nr:LysR family transcriptional regulator [Shewanella polaris]